MITTEPAPEPVEQTDVNPRCEACKCAAHPDGKCPNRWCGHRKATT